MGRNCLIISYYFPPAGGGGVQRWTKLIKYLSPLGWNFTVISAETDTMLPEDNSLVKELPGEIKVIRIHSAQPAKSLQKQQRETSYWKRWLSAFFYITDSRIKWNKYAYPVILEELNRANYDVIVVSIPPYTVSSIAADLSETRKEPVVLDMRDPWTINPYKIYPTPLHRHLDQKREVRTISKVNYLVSAYNSITEHYKSIMPGFEKKKSIIISNGYDSDDIPDMHLNKDRLESRFNLGFSGTFYSHLNRPDNLFEAIRRLKNRDENIHFYHIGKSAYDLKAVARKYKIEHFVHATGYLSHENCIVKLQTMDAFVLILDDRIRHAEKTIGGKVYEYLALKKPILALIPEEGEAADFIRFTDSGIVCPYSNINRICEALQLLLSGKKTFYFNHIEQYTRKNLAARLGDFFNEIIHSRS